MAERDAQYPTGNAPIRNAQTRNVPAPHAEYRDPAPFSAQVHGLSLTFYPAGHDRLAALLEMIGGARDTLKMAFYIFSPDATGTKVRDALVAAAGRGVKVTVILDDFGSLAGREFFRPMIDAGGVFHCFMSRASRRYLIRNHQKIVVADGHVVMLGGFNIEDSYFDPPAMNGWNDLAVVIQGPLARRVEHWFDELQGWASRPKARFFAIRRKIRGWNAGNEPVQLLIGGPTMGLSSWARCVSDDFANGRRLDMMMAYFSPPRRLQRRIARIAAHGETRLIMAGKSDNGATIGASRSLYAGLLRSGARIWEFQPCKMHTKLIVLDDAVYFGSANFDMRSLYLNLEIVVRIEDAALADLMRGFIAQHLPASEEITPQLHARRSGLFNRLRWAVSWFLVSVVDYTVSRKLNLGLQS